MGPNKQDSFSPKRATNIDGFFAKPIGDRPRQPVFRAPAANPQPPSAKLVDMPQRRQPILSTASMAGSVDVPTYPLPGGERRRQPVGGSLEEPRRRRGKVKQRRGWKHRLKRTVQGLGVIVLLLGLFLGAKFYKDIAKLTGNKNPFSLFSVFHPVPLQNQNGRVNILVAANSADDPGHNGANLTDSIMILSINTNNNTAAMVSVPRDLWVDIPGVGHAKINDAYPNGGMNKLQSVVQDNLGMTIDYTALVNYGAFKDLVNAVGGITIDIQSSDPRGIYDPNLDYTTKHCCALAKYPNGPVTLDGQQALDLARARGDPNPYGIPYGFPDGDFDRTEHQRQMLQAIKDKADKTSVIANPFKVSALVDAVGNNVKTDLQLDEIETLYSDMKKIPDNKIASLNINSLNGGNTTLLQNYTSPDGQSALIPAAGIDDFSDIQTALQKALSADPITREGANVVILNGTETVGLALKQENKLLQKGMTVTIGDAPATQPTNTLIDNSNGQMPNTLAYLKQQYNVTLVTDVHLTAAYPSADFILILGQSAVPQPSVSAQ